MEDKKVYGQKIGDGLSKLSGRDMINKYTIAKKVNEIIDLLNQNEQD